MSEEVALDELVTPERVVADVEVQSKKRALERLSTLLAEAAPNLPAAEIFESLLKRERLGSTGLGQGIAIPHGRLAGLEHPIGALITLGEPVAFDAADDAPVDLVFALLVPEQCSDEHLQILSRLAELFREPRFTRSLREAADSAELFRAFAGGVASQATA